MGFNPLSNSEVQHLPIFCFVIATHVRTGVYAVEADDTDDKNNHGNQERSSDSSRPAQNSLPFLICIHTELIVGQKS